jgi:hypothetical protein
MQYKYEIAISFAEEDRNAALALALAFELEGCSSIYYYPDRPIETLGKRLEETLTEIYTNEAKFAVILLSARYFNRDKKFTRIELKAIRNRMKKDPGTVYLIPVLLEEGFSLKGYAYLGKLTYERWEYKPRELARVLRQKLGAAQPVAESHGKKPEERINIKQKNVNKHGQTARQENSVIINR